MDRWKEETRRLILDPNSWPLWPRLPMKHTEKKDTDGFPQLGVIVGESHLREGEMIKVRIGSLFEDLTNAPTDEFASVDGLLAAGWRVD